MNGVSIRIFHHQRRYSDSKFPYGGPADYIDCVTFIEGHLSHTTEEPHYRFRKYKGI